MAQQTKRNSRPPTAGTSQRSGGGTTNGSRDAPPPVIERRSLGRLGFLAKPELEAAELGPLGGHSKRSNKSKSTSGGNGLTDVAKKAKTPALAAGAGLAGLAGGLALANRTTRKRIFGVRMPSGGAADAVSKNLVQAAENVGSFGEGMGSLAAEIRRVREGVALAGEPSARRSRSCFRA